MAAEARGVVGGVDAVEVSGLDAAGASPVLEAADAAEPSGAAAAAVVSLGGEVVGGVDAAGEGLPPSGLG